MSPLKRIFTALLLVFLPGTAWPNDAPCWDMTATWELCAHRDDAIRQFGWNNAVDTTIDGRIVNHVWFAEGKLGYQARSNDLVPWESLKQKMIDAIHLIDARHSEVTRHGIEFVEWQVRRDGTMQMHAYGLIEGKEVYAITATMAESEGFDIRNAHEFFMSKVRPKAND